MKKKEKMKKIHKNNTPTKKVGGNHTLTFFMYFKISSNYRMGNFTCNPCSRKSPHGHNVGSTR